MKEQAVLFGTASELVGVLTDPAEGRAPEPVAVILLNAGLLHRVGPNRLYVQLARELAARGFLTLRFDFSGIGDSAQRRDARSFDEGVEIEVKEAMDLVGRRRGIDRFVLMGLCAGAVRSFNVACADTRVTGVALINPQGYDDQITTLADARRYWRKVLRALVRPQRWATSIPRNANAGTMATQLRQLFAGRSSARDVGGGFGELLQRAVEILVVFSSVHQRGVEELETALGGRLRALRRSRRFRVQTIGEATHTFDHSPHQRQFLEAIATWMQATFATVGWGASTGPPMPPNARRAPAQP